MQFFSSQLSKYIPHPHRDSWMRNNLGDWLQLLRIASFFTLSSAAWNVFHSFSPIGIEDQFHPLLHNTSETAHQSAVPDEHERQLNHITTTIHYLFIALFVIAALFSFRCGPRKKPKYILPVFFSGSIMAASTIHHAITAGYEIISITPYLLPISIPFLLISYRRLANKLDHWNSYASALCIFTIFGNAFTYLLFPENFPQIKESVFTAIGLPAESGPSLMTTFSYVGIVFALFITSTATRRLGLFALIYIGATTCVYRIVTQSLDNSISVNRIITDAIFYSSYWFVPMLILLSLASRRKTQTLKL